MRPEKLVATLTKSAEDVGPAKSIQVADAPAPVDQVEVRLRLGADQRSLRLGNGAQLPISAGRVAAWGSGAAAGIGPAPPSGVVPWAAPFVGAKLLRRRPRRRRNLRGGAAPFS